MADQRSDAAVREVVLRFDEALDQQDLATALALCTDDVVFIGSGEGEQAVGRDAVAELAVSLAERIRDVEFRVTDTVLSVEVAGDVALVTSFGTAHLRSPRGVREGPYRMT